MIEPVPFAFEKASASVRLRIVRDLWGARPPEPLLDEALNQPEIVQLARSQRRDGTWACWLHRAGLSTENATTRLAELGCPRDRPPLDRALPPLLALLEGERTPFVDLRRPGPEALMRTRLRRVAAGLLCQAGLGDRKIVQEAIEQEVARVHLWVSRARREGLPLRTGRSGPGEHELVYLPEALDNGELPVPDLYWLRAVAFAPGSSADPRVRDVLRFLAEPEYQRLAAAGLGVLALAGQRVRPGFGVRRSDPELASREGRLGEALCTAELLARAGDPGPARRVTRFLDAQRDATGRVMISSHAFRRGGGYTIQRGWARLSTPWRERSRAIDLAFRRLLLSSLSGARPATRE